MGVVVCACVSVCGCVGCGGCVFGYAVIGRCSLSGCGVLAGWTAWCVFGASQNPTCRLATPAPAGPCQLSPTRVHAASAKHRTPHTLLPHTTHPSSPSTHHPAQLHQLVDGGPGHKALVQVPGRGVRQQVKPGQAVGGGWIVGDALLAALVLQHGGG